VLHAEFPGADFQMARRALDASAYDLAQARELLGLELGAPEGDAAGAPPGPAQAGDADAGVSDADAGVSDAGAGVSDAGAGVSDADAARFFGRVSRQRGEAGRVRTTPVYDLAEVRRGDPGLDEERQRETVRELKVRSLADEFPTARGDTVRQVLEAPGVDWNVGLARAALRGYGLVSAGERERREREGQVRELRRRLGAYSPGDEYAGPRGPNGTGSQPPARGGGPGESYARHRSAAGVDAYQERIRQVEGLMSSHRGDRRLFDALLTTRRRLVEERNARSRAAGDRIYRETNRAHASRNAITVDLHGLHVAEAEDKVEQNLSYARGFAANGTHLTLRIITGRGNNSGPGGARLKPAILELLECQPDFEVEVDRWNDGQILATPARR